MYCSMLLFLTLSSLNLPLSPQPLQAANCCRNSRLVEDEDDLEVGEDIVIIKAFPENV